MRRPIFRQQVISECDSSGLCGWKNLTVIQILQYEGSTERWCSVGVCSDPQEGLGLAFMSFELQLDGRRNVGIMAFRYQGMDGQKPERRYVSPLW